MINRFTEMTGAELTDALFMSLENPNIFTIEEKCQMVDEMAARFEENTGRPFGNFCNG